MSQNNTELQHHGIPGMKWGIRRYQNKDGSLTPAGRKKVARMKEEYTSLTGKRLVKKAISKNSKSVEDVDNNKSVKDMSDYELKTKTDRLNAEKNYMEAVKNHKNISDEHISKGRKIVNTVMNDMITPAATDVGKQLIKSYMTKAVNDGLKLDDEYKIYTNNKKKN